MEDNHIQKGLMLISSERGISLKSRFVPKSELLEAFSTIDTAGLLCRLLPWCGN